MESSYPKSHFLMMLLLLLLLLSRFSRVQLFATPWTVACQAPLSMGFSREEYWSGFLFPSPGTLPRPGIERVSPALAGTAISEAPIYISTIMYEIDKLLRTYCIAQGTLLIVLWGPKWEGKPK